MAGPYDTTLAYVEMPAWVSEETEQKRLGAYAFYRDLYLNHSDAFRLTLRDDEGSPIFIPSARRIVRTMGRYVCRGLGFDIIGGTADQQNDFRALYDAWFKREEFFANFRDALEDGLAEGDFMLYIFAEPWKPEGSRLSIRFISPGTVFFIPDENDLGKVVGVRVIEQITIEDKPYIRVQRWLKSSSPDHPDYVEQDPTSPTALNPDTAIWYDAFVLETQDWEDIAKRKIYRTDQSGVYIDGITQLPIYHFPNRKRTGEIYGISELQGIERLMLGINQSVTDEDVTLAMHGLGMYASNTTPKDENGQDTDWVLGPRRVVELNGTKAESYFERVNGVSTVTPMQDHYKFLIEQAETTSGINDVALGTVDTSVAQSGIALALRMGPILDEAERKDLRLLARLTQFLYDTRQWLAVYENIGIPEEMMVIPTVGAKLPRDVDKEMARLQDLYANGVISTELYVTKLNEMGMDLGDPAQVAADAEAEGARRQAAGLGLTMDETEEGGAARLDEEAGAPFEPEE